MKASRKVTAWTPAVAASTIIGCLRIAAAQSGGQLWASSYCPPRQARKRRRKSATKLIQPNWRDDVVHSASRSAKGGGEAELGRNRLTGSLRPRCVLIAFRRTVGNPRHAPTVATLQFAFPNFQQSTFGSSAQQPDPEEPRHGKRGHGDQYQTPHLQQEWRLIIISRARRIERDRVTHSRHAARLLGTAAARACVRGASASHACSEGYRSDARAPCTAGAGDRSSASDPRSSRSTARPSRRCARWRIAR